MEYLHTMIRVSDLDESLDFFCGKLGLVEVARTEVEAGRFTLVFLAAPGDEERAREHKAPTVELTYNWDPEEYSGGRNFGHLAYRVDDIYATCERLRSAGVTINRPPARRAHGLHPIARRDFDRVAPEGRIAAPARAVGVDGKHRDLVVT